MCVRVWRQHYHQNWCGGESPASRPRRTSPAPVNRGTDSLTPAHVILFRVLLKLKSLSNNVLQKDGGHLIIRGLRANTQPWLHSPISLSMIHLSLVMAVHLHKKLTYLLVLSAASSSFPRNGDLHFRTKQSHGGGYQHQVGKTLLHYHSCHVRLLGRITCLL